MKLQLKHKLPIIGIGILLSFWSLAALGLMTLWFFFEIGESFPTNLDDNETQ